MRNFVRYKPTRRVKISLYKHGLNVIFRWLSSKGVNIEILQGIDLNNIQRHSHQLPQFIRPHIMYHDKSGDDLTGQDIIEMFELSKFVPDIDAFLYLVHDLIYNDTIESFNFVSPVKLFLNQDKTTSVWLFCLVRKINGKIYLELNHLLDKKHSTPIFPGDWNVVGFSPLYFSEKLEINRSFVKVA